VKNPQRTYPLAMLLSVVLMLVTYLFPIATAIGTAGVCTPPPTTIGEGAGRI
jgi:amino acid transporter